ncbi:hypothetical protein Syun_008068 [Stephania yunnanensis]|uniref:BZIP domain-containing protein n=1 Tax=Stephania yunnanensis TaxID=152371 RepID=A0AAP0KZL1_9MAGN
MAAANTTSHLLRRIRLLSSFSVVFLYWFYVVSLLVMPRSHQQQSSGSEGDRLDRSPPSDRSPQSDLAVVVVADERKKRRMISNRESARRSRMRKQQHLDDLINQAAQIQRENGEIAKRVSATTEMFLKVDSENSILRAQVGELSERLQSLNSVLHTIEEVSGFAMDIPEMPDPLLKPWHLPYPSQPIMASAHWLP